jgi:hypothetical protein
VSYRIIVSLQTADLKSWTRVTLQIQISMTGRTLKLSQLHRSSRGPAPLADWNTMGHMHHFCSKIILSHGQVHICRHCKRMFLICIMVDLSLRATPDSMKCANTWCSFNLSQKVGLRQRTSYSRLSAIITVAPHGSNKAQRDLSANSYL